MTDDRLLTVMLILGMLVICMVVIAVYQIRARKKEQEGAEERARRHEVLVEMGMRTPDGHPACIVCRLRASEYAPITGASWMDRLPLLNRLFSLPPRHVIVDNLDGDLCFCRLHKQMAVSMLEEEHAKLRAERAKFNATQEAKVAALDGGELLQRLIQTHREHMRNLKLSETPLPRLSQHAGGDGGIVTAVVTSPSMIPEEDS
jgi:hypothetical protein